MRGSGCAVRVLQFGISDFGYKARNLNRTRTRHNIEHGNFKFMFFDFKDEDDEDDLSKIKVGSRFERDAGHIPEYAMIRFRRARWPALRIQEVCFSIRLAAIQASGWV